MWGKKAFLLAAIVLTLTSAANADLVLTLNGFDAAKECIETEGKNNLVIAVAGDTEVDPNAYRIEAVGGVLNAKAGPNTVSPQAKAEDYSFTFEDESTIGIVRLIANNDMVIDGTSVKEGGTIYELFLAYVSETDTVVSCGVNLESLSNIPPEPEPQPVPELNPEPEAEVHSESEPAPEPQPVPNLQPVPELQPQPQSEPAPEPQPVPELKPEPKAEAQPQLGPATESQPKTFPPLYRQKPERINKLKYFPEVNESLNFKFWEKKAINPGFEKETVTSDSPTEFSPYLSTPSITLGAGPSTSLRAGTLKTGGTELSGEPDGESSASLIIITDGTVITGITTWDSDVYIFGEVIVAQGAKLIAKGHTIWFSYDGYGHIVVEPGGCVEFIGDNFFPDRYDDIEYPYNAISPFAIRLEPGVSSSSEISYCRFFGAYRGIFNLDNKIALHDNIFQSCDVGVGQYGPRLSDVVNSYFIDNGVAIGQHFDDIDGIAASNKTENSIVNNTIIFSECGIVCFGVPNPDDAGKVTIANNLMATCGLGVCLVNGWMIPWVVTNGFFENTTKFYGYSEDEQSQISEAGAVALDGESSGDDPNTILIDNFDEYQPPAGTDDLKAVWKDYDTQDPPKTCAVVFPAQNPHCGEESSWSMGYQFLNNQYEPYYSEVRADVNTARPNGLGMDPNWLGTGAKALSLWFYGTATNDANQQMYVKLTDGDQEDFYIVDDFDSYDSVEDMRAVWKDYYTQPAPRTCAEVYVGTAPMQPVRSGDQSMRYKFMNYTYSPYYSEAIADVCDLPSKIGSDWLGLGAETLSLWFYGEPNNDANEQMYIKLVDSDNPVHTAKVFYSDYGDMNDIREEKWHQWNIPLRLTDLADVNLADVNKIIIGFGDGTQAASDGTVYFEDIRLYKEFPPRQHTAKVLYNGNMNDIKQTAWHIWNIPFTELSDINLANVKTITIGFGDGNQAASDGTVYFDDISLGDGNYVQNDPYDEGSVILFDDPFTFGVWGLLIGYYLPIIDQYCPLVDGGYGYIDEYPGLLGKTTDIDGLSDSKCVDIGFHLLNWNFKELGSGGELPADLDGNQTVDFGDFAIFANYWLQSTSEAADLDGSGFVDYDDLSLFVDEWQHNGAIYIDFFRINNGFESTDLNNVSGDISVGPRNIPPDVGEVFIYVDDTQVASWVSGISEWDGFFKSDNFSNGQHEIRLMTIDFNYVVTNYQPINAYFNNAFYNIIAPEYFYPTTDYNIMGFHNGDGSFEVKLADHNDQILWSNTYSGPSVNISIPPAAFGDAQLCKLSIKESGSGMMMASSSEGCEEEIYKPFVKENFVGVKMVLLLPNPDLISAKLSLICNIINSCKSQKVPYGVVYHHDNTPENWTYIFNTLGGRKDIYYAGHANSHIGKVQRTNLVTYKKIYMLGIPWPSTYYIKVPALSYTTRSEPDAERLPNDLDNSGFDLRDLGLKDDDKIEIGWFDGCRTAGYETVTPTGVIVNRTPCEDLARTFGFFSDAANGNHRSIFFGWRIATESYPGWHEGYSFVNSGQELIWARLGTGGTIAQALEVTDGANIHIRHALWGEDKCRLDDPSGYCGSEDNNLVFYGDGNIWVIKLEPN